MTNTREFAWKNITATYQTGKMASAAGIVTLQEVSYTSQMELGALYGQGDAPRSIQQGNRSYEGQIAVLQSDYEKLRQATENFEFDFNIVVKYLLTYTDSKDKKKKNKIQTHTLECCYCAGAEYSMSQGELGQILTIPFMFTKVTYANEKVEEVKVKT